jgi:hypothetical protein
MLWRRPKVIGTDPGAPGDHRRFAPLPPLEKARRLEYDIYSFAERRRAAVLPIVGAEAAFHALGVIETCDAVDDPGGRRRRSSCRSSSREPSG